MSMEKETLGKIFKKNKKKPLANYAFSFFLYVQKMCESCIADGITDLFFLSREGQFLKKLTEIYISKRKPDFPVRLHYLYVSRKACIAATLDTLDKEEFLPYRCFHALSLKLFLRSLDFSDDDIERIAATIKENSERKVSDFFNCDVWRKLKTNAEFAQIYEKKRTAVHERFLRYLSDAGFDKAQQPALVDVGWSGTMQDRLLSLGFHDTLSGYYMGLSGVAGATSHNRKHGLLFDCNVGRTPCFYNHAYYEFICVADHGSVRGYDEKGQPVLQEDTDVTLYKEMYRDIQKNIEAAFSELCALPFTDTVMNTLFQKYHARMLLNFSKSEKEIINASVRSHTDNFIAIKKIWRLRLLLFNIKRWIFLFVHAYVKQA